MSHVLCKCRTLFISVARYLQMSHIICKFSSVPKTSSDALVCLKVTSGHDSESSSHYHDQSCTMAESTSLKEPVNKAIDTVTNSATSLKLTQVDASSTGGHESVGPPTLVSSDDGVSASQGLPTSKVLHIDCPVSSRTRSKVIQHRSLQDLGNDSTTVLPSNSKPSVSNAKPPSVEPRNNLELVLPASLQGVTQHHMDFIRCDDLDTGCSHEINSHEINSHKINSHEINSHEINFSRGQFPYDQLNFFLSDNSN